MLYLPSIFEPVRKLLRWEKISIDNLTFRLHYKVSTLLMLVFVVMVTAKAHFGDPIDCSYDNSNLIPVKLLNSICWLHGTYTVKFNRKIDEINCLQELSKYDKEECYIGKTSYSGSGLTVLHHAYYQWISWVLFLQALLFYVPRFIWKYLEGGRVKFIIESRYDAPALKKGDQNSRFDRVFSVYEKYIGRNKWYALKFFFCEVANFLIVLLNLWILDQLFHGRFINYGLRFFQDLSNTDGTQTVMDEVFPKMATCSASKRGKDGELISHSAKCLLAMNIINDKVYLAMWVWIWFLVIMNTLTLLYRLITIAHPDVRYYILRRRLSNTSAEYQFKQISIKVGSVARYMPIGDWFLLRQISKNVDDLTFAKLMEKIAESKAGYLEKPFGIPTEMIMKKLGRYTQDKSKIVSGEATQNMVYNRKTETLQFKEGDEKNEMTGMELIFTPSAETSKTASSTTLKDEQLIDTKKELMESRDQLIGSQDQLSEPRSQPILPKVAMPAGPEKCYIADSEMTEATIGTTPTMVKKAEKLVTTNDSTYSFTGDDDTISECSLPSPYNVKFPISKISGYDEQPCAINLESDEAAKLKALNASVTKLSAEV